MRVEFFGDFDYTPTRVRQVTIAYKAGMVCTVKRECGEQAVAAGKAKELITPQQEAPENGEAAR